MTKDPHGDQPIRTYGEPLEGARAAMVMVHGRGATAESILTLADVFGQTGFAFVAPAAAANTWYPHSFLAPIEQNEPWLSSALAFIDRVMQQVAAAGIPSERTMLLGFSQGACLALEYAARHARPYGGVVALSGGLIGTGSNPSSPDAAPPDDKAFDYDGTLDGTPVFLGCSDVDAHIPVRRVHQSTEALRRLGANVTERIYPGMGHTVNEDEVAFVRDLVTRLVAPPGQA